MLKKTSALLIILILLPILMYSATEIGIMGNFRTVSESSVKDAYGNSFTVSPYIELKISDKFLFGASYEFGYKKDADIGLKNDLSTLKIHGGDLYLSYTLFNDPLVKPYIKAGAGYYHFKQTINSSVFTEPDVSESKLTWLIGAGVRYSLSTKIRVRAEIKYSPFKVDGYRDTEPDIGGFRLGAGIGLVL